MPMFIERPAAEIYRVDFGAGHVPTMTHPHAVAQALDQFFAAADKG
jgi:hypothetical protein